MGVPLYITDDHFVVFFANFVEVADVSSIKIASVDFEIMVTLTKKKKKLMDIPNILTRGDRPIYVVVEGRRPF